MLFIMSVMVGLPGLGLYQKQNAPPKDSTGRRDAIIRKGESSPNTPARKIKLEAG
jgi:hypothetical protein